MVARLERKGVVMKSAMQVAPRDADRYGSIRQLAETKPDFGAALAGMSGALGGAMIGAYPGADLDVLLYALVVVIIGGMGNLTGSLVGAMLVGLIDVFGRAIIPELGASVIFLLMFATLTVRPAGLFGSH